MTAALAVTTLNACLVFMAIMFTACIACEFIKDDMKLLYQGVILLVNGAIGLVVGWSLFADNILYGSSTLSYDPLGWIVSTFGALCGVLLFVIWLPRALKPLRGGSDFSHDTPRRPMRPREPGGL
jgi:hypothetical protein